MDSSSLTKTIIVVNNELWFLNVKSLFQFFYLTVKKNWREKNTAGDLQKIFEDQPKTKRMEVETERVVHPDVFHELKNFIENKKYLILKKKEHSNGNVSLSEDFDNLYVDWVSVASTLTVLTQFLDSAAKDKSLNFSVILDNNYVAPVSYYKAILTVFKTSNNDINIISSLLFLLRKVLDRFKIFL